jgi:hypothetical protein
MTQSLTAAQKRKRSPSRQWGCLKLLLIPILLSLACYGSMWVFARYGGKLATSYLPMPPDSQFVKAIYEHREYTFETTLYFHSLSPEQLREWYIQSHVWMSPGKSWDYSNYPIYLDYEDFYSTDPLLSRFRNDSSAMSIIYTSSVVWTSSWQGRWEEWCDHVYIYKNKAAFAKHYPDITLPDGMSAFEVATCWRNIK